MTQIALILAMLAVTCAASNARELNYFMFVLIWRKLLHIKRDTLPNLELTDVCSLLLPPKPRHYSSL